MREEAGVGTRGGAGGKMRGEAGSKVRGQVGGKDRGGGSNGMRREAGTVVKGRMYMSIALRCGCIERYICGVHGHVRGAHACIHGRECDKVS